MNDWEGAERAGSAVARIPKATDHQHKSESKGAEVQTKVGWTKDLVAPELGPSQDEGNSLCCDAVVR